MTENNDNDNDAFLYSDSHHIVTVKLKLRYDIEPLYIKLEYIKII